MSNQRGNGQPTHFGRRSLADYDQLSRDNYDMNMVTFENDEPSWFSSGFQQGNSRSSKFQRTNASSSQTAMRHSDNSWPEEDSSQPTFGKFRRRNQSQMSENIIDLDTDEENVRKPEIKIPKGAEVIEIGDMDNEFEKEAEREIQEASNRPQSYLPSLGCSPIELPWVELDSYKLRPKVSNAMPFKSPTILKSGECVELFDGAFLHIDKITQNLENDEVVLRGWKLVRTRIRELGGLLPKKLNELCYVFEYVLDDPRSIKEQNVILIHLSNVVQIRELVCTNFPFPELRFENNQAPNGKYAEQNMKLVVRWKFITSYKNELERARNLKYPLHIRQRKLERLTEGECSRGCFMSADILRATYRPKPPIPSGKLDYRAKTIDNGKCRTEMNPQRATQRGSYTFGDAFCGAGGTTCGAKAAGLKIKWGLDCAPNASKTWVSNFPEAEHFQMTAFEMVGLKALYQHLVDVLHLSPPCQVWSPVHTREGQNDEQNFAALFACEELLKRSKPRFVTLEQTFGILHPKFASSFNALIQMFTAHGYAVCWQILEFQRYGLAQSRRRCIIIAAGPGDTLPKIPEYTHSDKPFYDGLKPFTSASSIISSVPANAPNHNIQEACSGNQDKFAPWDGSGIINCITCDGGVFGHPSGTRGLTHREIAALQSFPHHHVFKGSEIKKQIGNAFASMIAHIVLYRPIMKHLKETDMVQAEVVDLTN